MFYDGCNEMHVAQQRMEGSSDGSVLTTAFAGRIRGAIESQDAKVGGLVAQDHSPVTAAAAIRRGAEQYRKGAAMARDVSSAHGVPAVMFWQPVLATRQPMDVDEPLIASGLGSVVAGEHQITLDERLLRSIGSSSHVDPLDLTDSLDHLDREVYTDDCHTNEAGAKVVAEAMWLSIQAALGGG